MPEDTSSPPPPSAPRSRRSSRTEVEESGGSKILIIVLSLVIAGLGIGLFMRHSSAESQAGKDAVTISMLTSNVAELRTKLTLDQGNAAIALTNSQGMLDRRTAELTTASNRLVQTVLLLNRAQEETRAVQAEIPAKAAAVAALEAQRDDLRRQTAIIPALQQELVESRDKVNQAQFDHASLQATLGRVQLERTELERKLEDPLFLHLQEKRVLEAAEIRQQTATKQRINVSDPRVRLELQPDGTVRPAVASGTPSRQ